MPAAVARSRIAEEQVLVVPASVLDELGRFQGFSADIDRYLQPLLRSDRLAYRPRSAMEEDPSYKQLIPYVVLRYSDPSGGAHVFSYTRGGGGGESRLHAKRSLGVGGHISTDDAAHEVAGRDDGLYRRGLERELAEEVRIDAPHTERLIGLINDDSTPVGQVHLGVLHVLDLEAPRVASAEPDLAEGSFVPADRVLAELDHYETWSQIAARAVLG
ncbi:phosphoesterase [Botrimarina sp.]|uniref:phosphoesterase n=1 Tax=Botrimarina sp. TaxID=2795802 RepID=UPI0032EEFBE5